MKLTARSLSGNEIRLDCYPSKIYDIRSSIAEKLDISERQIALFYKKNNRYKKFLPRHLVNLKEGDEIGYWIYQSIPEWYQKDFVGTGHSFVYEENGQKCVYFHLIEGKYLYNNQPHDNISSLLENLDMDESIAERISHLWEVYGEDF